MQGDREFLKFALQSATVGEPGYFHHGWQEGKGKLGLLSSEGQHLSPSPF